MLGEICAELKNYFTYEEDRHVDDWVISGGTISPYLDIPTDYIRVIGSRHNDGVHVRNKDGFFDLIDESFHGGIWVMSPPSDFLSLVTEISEWQTKYGGIDSYNMSPFQSESYSIYSYTKGSSNSSESGSPSSPSWQTQYADRLNRYRRIREL